MEKNRIAHLEPRIYKHEQLINELNQLMIDIKLALYHDRAKPTVEELDRLHIRVREVLMQDSTLLRKRH